MYPKVALDFFAHQTRYGDTSILPTPTFFYGMRVGDEVALNIAPGKTLMVSLQGLHDDEAAGAIKVLFELNGQSRTVMVAKAGASGALRTREVAQAGMATQVGAPMPGVVVTVAASEGQTVEAGAVLLSLEAMKMEMQITAERSGVIERILVKAGDRVQAKDLLVVWRA